MNTQTNTLPAITIDGRTSLGVIYASDFTTSTTDVLRDRWTEGKMKAVVDALDGRPVVIELGGGSGFALAGRLEAVVGAWPGRGPRVTVASLNGTRTSYRLDNVGMILEVAESITDGDAKFRALDLYRTRKQAAQDAVRDAFPDWLGPSVLNPSGGPHPGAASNHHPARQKEPTMTDYTDAAKIAEERRQDAEDTLAAEAAKLRDYLDKADAPIGRGLAPLGSDTPTTWNLGAAVAASANRMAEVEGAHKAWAIAAAILRGALDSGTVADPTRLFALLLDGADDTWSGRGNDVRRAYADGVRRAVAEAVRLFR